MNKKNISTFGYSSPGGREVSEDCCGMYRYGKNLVTVVADGLGGEGNGDVAAVTALEQLSCCGQSGDLPDAAEIGEYFDKANREILLLQQEGKRMKTTAVYLCIHENRAVWAHIGDSRLYHFYQNKLVHVTLDHSVSQLAVFMKEIKRSDIPSHKGRSQLFRALGTEDMEPDIGTEIQLLPGKHAFLLCTDGFWEYLKDEELSGLLSGAETAKDWIDSACCLIEQRRCADSDNNTAMAVMMEV